MSSKNFAPLFYYLQPFLARLAELFI